jgi:two-component system phosphate regulon response regulator PhoB
VSKVLIVDDERDLVSGIEFNLRQAGFETAVAHTGSEALAMARSSPPSIIVLDLMLPDLPGTEVCRQLKQDAKLSSIPILMLTAKAAEIDRVVGFELGAEDYVTKPFSVRELTLRVQALLRRTSHPPSSAAGKVRFGLLELDLDSHRAWISDEEMALTALEFRLLSYFVARPERVHSRELLLNEVWGVSAHIETRTVDTHVKRLREKIGAAGEYLETVRGVGYRFHQPEGASG